VIVTDLCVIGGGSAGLSIAAGAVQMGARVVLIEAGEMGGDCLNYGCVPSKALIAAGGQAHAMRRGGAGIAGVVPVVDFGAVKDHVAGAIAAIAPHDSQARFEGLGCRVIRARARFVGRDRVQAGDQVIRARRFVVAAGSRPAVPDVPGLEDVAYLTNETIFALRERPEHLIILGGGPVGLEMAQAHRRLGCRVTVLARSKALAGEDPELAALALAALRDEGVEVLEHAAVARVSGGIEVDLADGRRIEGSHLLVATGRKANVEGLGLEAAGVDFTAKGITVGANLRTTNRRIFAVGDVTGGPQYTHVAGAHAATILKQTLFPLPARFAPRAIPRVTYIDPELAHIGLTEAEARLQYGDSIDIIRLTFAQNDRAVTMGETQGLLKLIARKGRPLGVSIFGPQAGEQIALWAIILQQNLKLSALTGTILPYPTLSELSKRAAGAYFSPRLFQNDRIKRVVRFVQRWWP
jgi:pyruvate/2-oxoglutarate dehydrogenase complex dihydrolipoamide dehydrogenase (E3) component